MALALESKYLLPDVSVSTHYHVHGTILLFFPTLPHTLSIQSLIHRITQYHHAAPPPPQSVTNLPRTGAQGVYALKAYKFLTPSLSLSFRFPAASMSKKIPSPQISVLDGRVRNCKLDTSIHYYR